MRCKAVLSAVATDNVKLLSSREGYLCQFIQKHKSNFACRIHKFLNYTQFTWNWNSFWRSSLFIHSNVVVFFCSGKQRSKRTVYYIDQVIRCKSEWEWMAYRSVLVFCFLVSNNGKILVSMEWNWKWNAMNTSKPVCWIHSFIHCGMADSMNKKEHTKPTKK